MTRNQMLDDLCVLLGGIEAERLLLDDISTGAAGSDLTRATILAHLIVETYGMGGPDTGLRQYRWARDGKRVDDLSAEHLLAIDRQVSALIGEAQTRAAKILRENRAALEMLRDEVLSKKTIEAKALGKFVPAAADEAPKKDEAKSPAPKKRGASSDGEKNAAAQPGN
jgi:cell division protease FtsH